MRGKNLVIGIYYHPEAYPPTLNALTELSVSYDSVVIVHRPHLTPVWNYPVNVQRVASGKPVTSKQQEGSGIVKKILFFLQFVLDLYKAAVKKRPEVMLLYDVHALFAYSLIRPFLFFKHSFWYHNHDVSELHRERKYSIGWFACKTEKKIFTKMDLFTLPTAERLQFFPVANLKGKYFVIPNFPALKFYQPFYQPQKSMNEISLIYQGMISEGLGLELIVPLLAEEIAGKKLKLVLLGNTAPAYKESLLNLAAQYGVADRVLFKGFTPYKDVPAVTSSCHIGIAIYSKTETMHKTMGTASNKIFEYAAVGLPVLYSDAPHFTKYLSGYDWAFPVQNDTGSIRQQLASILSDYPRYANNAHESFLHELNFETHFKQVTGYLESTRA